LQCDFSFLMTRHTLDHKIFVGKTLNHCKWVVFPWEWGVTLVRYNADFRFSTFACGVGIFKLCRLPISLLN